MELITTVTNPTVIHGTLKQTNNNQAKWLPPFTLKGEGGRDGRKTRCLVCWVILQFLYQQYYKCEQQIARLVSMAEGSTDLELLW